MKTNTTQKNIPKGWQRVKLGEILDSDKGRLPKNLTDTKLSDDYLPYLSIKTISGEASQYADPKTGVVAKNDDLLVIADGSRSGFLFTGHEGLVSSTFLRIRAQDRAVTNPYLYYLFYHLDFTDGKFRKGGAIPHFDYKQLNSLTVSLPSLPEQKKIAEILGTVDKEIQKTDKIIAATEKLKRGLTQQLFSRGIGHTKFKKTKVGDIPKEWSLLKLKDVAKFTNGKAHEKDISENGKYIVINSKFISTNGQVIKRSDKNLSPLLVGDIAMVMSDIPKGKAFAKCFLVEENGKYTLNQRICSIKATKINNKFLYYILNRNEYFLGFDNGVGQTNLRKDEVLDCPVQLPSSREQNEIVEMLSAVDKKISVNKKMKEKLTLLKKGLMQDLLSGKKRTI